MNPLPAICVDEITGGQIAKDASYAEIFFIDENGHENVLRFNPLSLPSAVINLQQAKLRLQKRIAESKPFSETVFLRVNRATGETVGGTDLLLRFFDEHDVETPLLLTRMRAEELKKALDKWLSSSDPSTGSQTAH